MSVGLSLAFLGRLKIEQRSWRPLVSMLIGLLTGPTDKRILQTLPRGHGTAMRWRETILSLEAKGGFGGLQGGELRGELRRRLLSGEASKSRAADTFHPRIALQKRVLNRVGGIVGRSRL